MREVEDASFSPLVLSATGGLANEATHFYKRLAERLINKWDQPYCNTILWLRGRLFLYLLRSAIQSIRGARSSGNHAFQWEVPVDIVNSESQISPDS